MVVTYNNLTIYAHTVHFDRKALHIHAEGTVVVEDGTQHSTADQADLSFSQGKATLSVR